MGTLSETNLMERRLGGRGYGRLTEAVMLRMACEQAVTCCHGPGLRGGCVGTGPGHVEGLCVASTKEEAGKRLGPGCQGLWTSASHHQSLMCSQRISIREGGMWACLKISENINCT